MTSPVQRIPLPEARESLIVVGTSVRKRVDILRAYLDSLAAQELPERTRLHPIFVADNLAPDALMLLRAWTEARGGEVLSGAPAPLADFSDDHPDSHQWSESAMHRVGAAKDRILARARALHANHVWLCDADLMCDRTTLKSLLGCAAPIATAVYWTRWSRSGAETRKVHAAPQVWLRHPYELFGMGYTEAEFRERLAKRTLTPVPGYGACTVIAKSALDAGVSFAPIDAQQGLMDGEDRHFCRRASALHLHSVADPWPDIFHIYHAQDDVPRIPEMYERLLTPHPERAVLGSLVSLTLTALEPLSMGAGGWTAVPSQHVRGRLGTLPLMPELEEAIYGLDRGATTVVPVHFPVHYPVPGYAGSRRLIRVTLNDTKPNGWPPVLEDELFVGPHSGAYIRTTEYTGAQLQGMQERV